MPKSGLSYTKNELVKINEFLFDLLQESRRDRIRIVYRGDKIKDLFYRLNILYEPHSPDYRQVIERLFMMGEKSKHFYVEKIGNISRKRFRLNDVSEEEFLSIFDLIHKSSKSKKTHHIDFFRVNNSFREYFSNKENKIEFCTSINSLKESKKMVIKDYYLTLLHQLATIDYKKRSMHLSATMDRNIAIRFAGHSRQSPAFVLHAWKPSSSSLRKYFQGSGLPMYQQVPFPKQKEVSFFAGILPQYIIGFEIMGKRNMFYNPAIQTNSITPLTFIEGLDIDQTYFENILRQTNYSRFFSTDGSDFVEHDTNS